MRGAAALLLCIASHPMLAAAPQSGRTALYTGEQAVQGRELYASSCAGCHGNDLRGASIAPPLAGPGFAATWSPESSVDDLFFIMRSTMPPAASGSLSPQQYVLILAYILQQNGYPAGRVPLGPDSLSMKQTRLRSKDLEAPVGPAPTFIPGNPKTLPGGGPTQDELNAAIHSERDWLYHTHDYSGSRFAAADQINASNVGQLRVVCAFQMGELSNFQSGPIVYNGTMFVTTTHVTVALDATNCRPKWRYTWEPKARELWLTNRGVAIKDGRLVRGTSDGYLVELNAQTGELIWARKVADSTLGQTFTMAPLIFEDLILIGPAGSENAISGWVGAFRLSDGSEVWRFQTVPDATEQGSGSWQNPSRIKLGGGAVWTPFSFDPDKRELFVAVTNPAPDFPANLRPGDNLYTNSIVVLDIRTGKLLWSKQMVRNDSHDWDLTQVSPLLETTVGGLEKSLVVTVGKDGMLRTIDRSSQKALYDTPITTIENIEVPVSPKGTFACPGVLGGVEWNGPAYNPATNLLYIGAVDWCSTFISAETVRHIPGKTYLGGTVQRANTSQGWITAVDAAGGQVRWKYRSAMPIVAAVTTTAGNLVMTGELSGDFVVLDARTGDVLYRFNTGGPIGGGVVTYQQDGKQYVAVASGRPSRFWVGQNAGSPTVFLFGLR